MTISKFSFTKHLQNLLHTIFYTGHLNKLRAPSVRGVADFAQVFTRTSLLVQCTCSATFNS